MIYLHQSMFHLCPRCACDIWMIVMPAGDRQACHACGYEPPVKPIDLPPVVTPAAPGTAQPTGNLLVTLGYE